MPLPRSGIVPYLFTSDAEALLDFYERVLGFEELSRWTDDDGQVTNAELAVGQTELWLDGGGPEQWAAHGRGPGQWIGVWVDDVDAVVERVRAQGVEIGDPVTRDFGVRMTGDVIDPEGNRWGFMQRLHLADPAAT